jgi:LPS-assembly lipoprotein
MSLFRRLRPTGLLIATIIVAACGFQPLYGSSQGVLSGAVVEDLAAVRITAIPDRVGQIVRNDLLDRLNPFGEPTSPRFSLAVELEEAKKGLAIQIDDTVTRFNLTLTANYFLTDAQTGAMLTAGSVRATAAYNVLRSDFANVIAERDAQQRAAREIADELNTRLAVFFGGSN